MALQRILSELKSLRRDPPSHCNASPVEDDMYDWEGFIMGAAGTPYEGELFCITICFAPTYHLQPLKVVFKTKVYHPNINRNGVVDMDVLRGSWSPAFTMSHVLGSIAALLADSNLEDPLVAEISELYMRDRSQ